MTDYDGDLDLIEESDEERDARDAEQERELLDSAQFKFTCFPCGSQLVTSSQELLSEFVRPHKDCEFGKPAYS